MGGEFVPGPTFRERMPRKRRHILAGVPFSKGVVTSHKPSSSLMYFFYCFNLPGLEGVSDATPIFEDRPNQGVKAPGFNTLWAAGQVALEEG